MGSFTLEGLEMRDKSSDCTLCSGGAVARGFARETFGAGAGFEALDFSASLASVVQALHQIQHRLQVGPRLPLEP